MKPRDIFAMSFNMLFAAICFGYWQHSVVAGIFVWCFLSALALMARFDEKKVQ
jgi:hypothetical protein